MRFDLLNNRTQLIAVGEGSTAMGSFRFSLLDGRAFHVEFYSTVSGRAQLLYFATNFANHMRSEGFEEARRLKMDGMRVTLVPIWNPGCSLDPLETCNHPRVDRVTHRCYICNSEVL